MNIYFFQYGYNSDMVPRVEKTTLSTMFNLATLVPNQVDTDIDADLSPYHLSVFGIHILSHHLFDSCDSITLSQYGTFIRTQTWYYKSFYFGEDFFP